MLHFIVIVAGSARCVVQVDRYPANIERVVQHLSQHGISERAHKGDIATALSSGAHYAMSCCRTEREVCVPRVSVSILNLNFRTFDVFKYQNFEFIFFQIARMHGAGLGQLEERRAWTKSLLAEARLMNHMPGAQSPVQRPGYIEKLLKF